MKEYTKTIRVQAVQWTGETTEQVQEMIGDKGYIWPPDRPTFRSRMIEGRVPLNGWVVRDSDTGLCWSETDEEFTRDYKEVSE